MAKINVRVRGFDHVLSADLAPGEAALFGRDPAVERLSFVPPARSVTAVPIASPHVSANHLLAWRAPEGGTWVLDLVSRNGSWLKLTPRAPTQVVGAEIVVDLAVASELAAGPPRLYLQEPWSGAQDFAARLCTSVAAWLDERGLSVSVHTEARSTPSVTCFHLADGRDLVVESQRGATLDTRLPALLDEVATFIDEQNALLDQEFGHDEDFVLRSPPFREAHRRIYDAAARGRRLLLLGASGTGKERLARCYHQHSSRREGPFKAVNCALVEKDMIWVQLFGAARGAYTGSVRDVAGAVETANGGTLFLDEVAELSPRVQAGLLRFLDRRGEYERLGETRVRRADVQIVAATNASLRDAVARGEFREDLWYRFAASVVQVPALRERPEDVLAFLDARSLGGRLSVRSAFAPAALDLVLQHAWPGNFRELENFVARLPLVHRPGAISATICRAALLEGIALPAALASSPEPLPAPRSRWQETLVQASSAYLEDHEADAPATSGEFRDFVEGYLKPLFVARACELDPGASTTEGLNCSALGRRLDICDGSTVKKLLERYFARFRGRSA